MVANMFESGQASLSTDIVGNISQSSDLDNGAVVSLPDGSRRNPFVTLSGISASVLANSPESFSIFSPGNTVIDWNEMMFITIQEGACCPYNIIWRNL